MERIILHCDCNSFFASVELLEHPELKAAPVAVGHDDDSRHGIVLAKNEPAKKFGIVTAETIFAAKRKCPGLIILPPHHEKYREYSKKLNEIYGQYTDLVEPFGIDESWLDVTGSLHLFGGDEVALADALRQRVFEKLGLTISVGVSFNKIYAKLGSDYKKPNATTRIGRDNYRQMVYPMPVGNMIYVGKAAEQALARLGVTTLGQLAETEESVLAAAFGKMGIQLRRAAAGLDESPVAAQAEPAEVKSIGNGMTFRRDLVTEADRRTGASCLSDEVARRLRKKGLLCTAVQVQIKGVDLKSISRQATLPRESDLAEEIAAAALKLVRANWPAARPIRALTITAERLVSSPLPRQLDLLEEVAPPDPKAEKLARTLDELHARFGRTAPGRGSLLGNDLGLADFGKKE